MLRRDAGERVLEPVPRVVDDHDHDDRRDDLGIAIWGRGRVRLHVLVGGIHDRPRLLARPARTDYPTPCHG